MRPTILLIAFLSFLNLGKAASLTEAQAISVIKSLPEFTDYSRNHKYSFDDTELIEGTTDGAFWRIDVHTIVGDPQATHLSLWNRFLINVDDPRYIMVWNHSHEPAYITLKQWQDKIRAEQGAAANP